MKANAQPNPPQQGEKLPPLTEKIGTGGLSPSEPMFSSWDGFSIISNVSAPSRCAAHEAQVHRRRQKQHFKRGLFIFFPLCLSLSLRSVCYFSADGLGLGTDRICCGSTHFHLPRKRNTAAQVGGLLL